MSGPAQTVYVSNGREGTVTPIDTATNTPGPPIPVGRGPGSIVITPDGKTAYVTSDESIVVPIDIAMNRPEAPIAVGMNRPGLHDMPDGIAITPDGKTVYVTNIGSGTVTPIDTATNTPAAPIEVGVRPRAITTTPDGKTAYVVNQFSPPPAQHSYEAQVRGRQEPAAVSPATVMPIDTATSAPGAPINVGDEPFAITVTPDGKTVYVANTWENTGRLATAPTTVTPIAVATGLPGTPIEVGRQPWAFAITPDGKTAYVINFGSASVTPIDTATNTAKTPIEIGEGARAIVITADGKTAYVAVWGEPGKATPIEIATNTAGTPIKVGGGPSAIAITPPDLTPVRPSRTAWPPDSPPG